MKVMNINYAVQADPEPPKILKFGVITEQPDGILLFSGFDIEVGPHNSLHAQRVLLEAVIARLKHELARITG